MNDKLASLEQCNVLREMIDNHQNRVMSSYMKGDNLVIETEDGEKCFVLPNGNKHPKLYYIEQQCIKCDNCDNTGWRRIDIATNKDQAESMKKHWQHYWDFPPRIKMIGRKTKVRINVK